MNKNELSQKKIYESPSIEVIIIQISDVITTSNFDNDGNDLDWDLSEW